jgi:hypothetical protein
MKVNTEFEIGEEVFIINFNSVMKLKITKILVEQKTGDVSNDPLVTYEFDNLRSGVNDGGTNYRYENEVGRTVAELIRKLGPKDNFSTTLGDGGVTDDLVKLQKFVRNCATNYDCDTGANGVHNPLNCRSCEARGLLII